MRLPRYRDNRFLWLGFAAAAAVVLLLVGSSVISRAQLGSKSVEAEFAQAAGLRPGATVDISGIEVGEVQKVELEGQKVVAVLRIRRDIELGADARAAIEMSTILGRLHIDLIPGDGKGLPGDRIPLSNTAVPYNLAKVIQDSRYTASFERIERIDPGKLREALDLLTQQMGESPQLTVAALDSIGSLARVVNNRRDEVDTLLKSMDQVSQLVADNRNSVLVLLTRGEAIGNAVALRQDLLRKLLDNVAALSALLQEMGVQNNGQFGPLIENLNTMTEGLEKNRDNLDRLYEIMPVGLRQFNNVLGNGPYGDVWAPWLLPDNWLCSAQLAPGCN
ncbi:MCE family protein [Nocardia asteroides]|uniref:MCE family protein n=1 Tax=Nocardia asteroides TaxID=1824 RepID=UPI001E42DEA6|nr:MCE family protein [Nocardia asteroides]UGT63605.1 MCE family protein [Nocardia asteroides]